MAVNPSFANVRKRKAQSFTPYQADYFVNVEGHLERKPIDKNTQAIIDSSDYTKLHELYDVMMAYGRDNMQNVYSDGIIAEREQFETDLDLFRRCDEIREQYAIENPEVKGMDNRQMIEYFNEKVVRHNEIIEKMKKEGQHNEKNIVEEGE